ncbi:hypothetical protein ACHAPT_004076 [Fusarium lateritium]
MAEGDEAVHDVPPSESTMDKTTEAKRDNNSPLDADGSSLDYLGSGSKSDDGDGNADDTGSHNSDPEVISLDLTPIENNMPRDYIDIAVTFACPRVSYIEAQLFETERETFRAFYQTLQRWPFLAGSFKVVKGDKGEKLTLVHAKGLTRTIVSRLFKVQQPSGDPCEALISPVEAHLTEYTSDCFFEHDQDVDNANNFPPVTLQINFKEGLLVLGFSLSRVIFDGMAINNFLRQYLRNTGSYRTTHSVTSRDMPEAIDPGLDNPYNLPFWDWDKSRDLEVPTPESKLEVKHFYLTAGTVQELRRNIRELDAEAQSSRVPNAQDCVFALFWVAIMRARCETGLLFPSDTAYGHVVMPGYFKKPHPWEYIGNSTVAAVASCKATDLAGPFWSWNKQSTLVTDLRQMARAANLLADAQYKISTAYMRKLHGLKQNLSPTEDRLASDRALRRHSSGICFEDWTGYASYCEAELPFITDPQPSIFACPDKLKEGTVILLPREDKTSGPEDWPVCVCLNATDLRLLEDILSDEGWWMEGGSEPRKKPEFKPKPLRELRPKVKTEGHESEGEVKLEY